MTITRNCIVCNKIFSFPKSQLNWRDPKYCSHLCHGIKAHEIRWNEIRKRMSIAHIGKKLSEDQKKKIGDAHRGRKRPIETGKKISESKLAKTGGLTPINMRIRSSQKYLDWRRDIFIRDSFTCQECGIKQVYLHAHHIKSFSRYPDLRFDRNNGLTLCRDCHKKTENFSWKAKL